MLSSPSRPQLPSTRQGLSAKQVIGQQTQTRPWEDPTSTAQRASLLLAAGTAGLAAGSRQYVRRRLHSGLGRRAAAAQKPEPGSEAIVVGAGPAGLASALMLADRGWEVIVIERSDDPAGFDPGRGFMYLIDGRGQKCLSFLGRGLLEELKTSSVAMAETRIGTLSPTGLKMRVNPMKDATRNSYWMPRHIFVQLLLRAAQEEPRIKFLTGAQLEELRQDSDGRISACGKAGDGTGFAINCSLLVGADGLKSFVRKTLEAWDGSKGRFVNKEFDSPAAGLRYKVLTLPSNFSVDVPEGKEEMASDVMYSVRGAAPQGRQHKLGLIPVKSVYGSRTANVITYADDAFWDVDDVDGLLDYARRQWPHFPMEELVPKEELERFAADRGGYFPRPQYSPAAALATKGKAGAVVLGDALHAFPPDIGQGVNSALEDVMALADQLEACGDGQPAAAVLKFEEERMPDVKALVEMVCVSAPYQYSQDPVRSKLWVASFLGRLLLNKVSPRFFHLPSFMLVQRSELPYGEAWAMAQRGARRARMALGVSLLGAVGLLARLVV